LWNQSRRRVHLTFDPWSRPSVDSLIPGGFMFVCFSLNAHYIKRIGQLRLSFLSVFSIYINISYILEYVWPLTSTCDSFFNWFLISTVVILYLHLYIEVSKVTTLARVFSMSLNPEPREGMGTYFWTHTVLEYNTLLTILSRSYSGSPLDYLNVCNISCYTLVFTEQNPSSLIIPHYDWQFVTVYIYNIYLFGLLKRFAKKLELVRWLFYTNVEVEWSFSYR